MVSKCRGMTSEDLETLTDDLQTVTLTIYPTAVVFVKYLLCIIIGKQ